MACLRKADDPAEFKKVNGKLSDIVGSKKLHGIKRQDIYFAREYYDKKKPLILSNKSIICEKGASYCTIVILYDPVNFRGSMVHVENEKIAKITLQNTIGALYSTGSKQILAVMIGANPSCGDEAKETWEASEKVLRNNHHVVKIVKKFCQRNVKVGYMVMWATTGDVKYTRTEPYAFTFDVFCEFTLSKF
jgi:hypothetical protein